MNGTSALLHLVRTSLELDRKGAFSATTLFDPTQMQYHMSYRPSSATWALGAKVNTNLPIYDSEDDLVRFHEYVTQFYDILKKILDYQPAAMNVRPECCVPRSWLEEWDFENLAAGRDPIVARETRLDSGRMGVLDRSYPIYASDHSVWPQVR